MIFILFYGILVTSSYGGAAVGTAEFSDLGHCNQAAAAYVAAVSSYHNGVYGVPYAYCMPKGLTKKDNHK